MALLMLSILLYTLFQIGKVKGLKNYRMNSVGETKKQEGEEYMEKERKRVQKYFVNTGNVKTKMKKMNEESQSDRK